MSTNPFEYVKDILQDGKNIIRNGEIPEVEEQEYNPFIVNKALSYNIDTVMDSNNMNLFHGLDNLMQFEYLINSVRKWKRPYTPWYKKEKGVSDLEIVKQAYGYSTVKAEAALAILTDAQVKLLKKKQEQR